MSADLIDVVVSDIHSRRRKLASLFCLIGLMDEHGQRKPGYRIIQVGDAVSAGYGMEEADFYEWWTGFLTDDDVELVGNHEAPILWPYDDRFKFYGYEPGDLGQAGCDPKLKPLVLARQKQYRVAYVVDDWLITHAGVRKANQRETAQLTADHLNRLWDEHMGPFQPHSYLDCPICCHLGGVLWVRDLEKTAKEPTKVKQIFGHTPDGPRLSTGGTMWNIDTPRKNEQQLPRSEAESWGGVAALVRRDHGWELNYVE